MSARKNSPKATRRELTTDDVTVVEESMLKRAVSAAALGNAMEWFDFGVYAYITTTIAQVFFPPGNDALNILFTSAPSPRPSWSARSAARSSARSATASAGRRCWP